MLTSSSWIILWTWNPFLLKGRLASVKRPWSHTRSEQVFLLAVTRITEKELGTKKNNKTACDSLSFNAPSMCHLISSVSPFPAEGNTALWQSLRELSSPHFTGDDWGSESSHHLPKVKKIGLEPRSFSRNHKRNATGLITQHTQEQQWACVSFLLQVPGCPAHGVAELLSNLRNPDPLREEGGPGFWNCHPCSWHVSACCSLPEWPWAVAVCAAASLQEALLAGLLGEVGVVGRRQDPQPS